MLLLTGCNHAQNNEFSYCTSPHCSSSRLAGACPSCWRQAVRSWPGKPNIDGPRVKAINRNFLVKPGVQCTLWGGSSQYVLLSPGHTPCTPEIQADRGLIPILFCTYCIPRPWLHKRALCWLGAGISSSCLMGNFGVDSQHSRFRKLFCSLYAISPQLESSD